MTTWEDVLRQACEVAGGETLGPDSSGFTVWRFPDGTALPENSKATPAYVAELLVAQIVEHDPSNKRLREFDLYLHRCVRLSLSTSNAQQRILAAMVALGHLKIEQAREVNGE